MQLFSDYISDSEREGEGGDYKWIIIEMEIQFFAKNNNNKIN